MLDVLIATEVLLLLSWTYVESGKTAQVNLLPGQELAARTESRHVDAVGSGLGWDELEDWDWHSCTTMRKVDTSGACCWAQGAPLGALWWPRGVRWAGGKEIQLSTYTCSWTLHIHIHIHAANSILFTVETNSTVKQLYSNKKMSADKARKYMCVY